MKFQAEDGIRDLRMSRGLGDVYKRQFLTLEENFQKVNNLNQNLEELVLLAKFQ